MSWCMLEEWVKGNYYMTYISRSTDFVNIYVESTDFVFVYVESRIKVHFSVAVIAVSMKPCIVIANDTLYKHTSLPGGLDLHFRCQ